MEADYDDRVHSGGLPTITVPSTVLDITAVRSQTKKSRYRDAESHREQSGAKSRVAAIVSMSCLEASCCLLVQVTVVTLATPI
jgi:hypothetical protein